MGIYLGSMAWVKGGVRFICGLFCWNPMVERARMEVLDLIYLDNMDGRWSGALN